VVLAPALGLVGLDRWAGLVWLAWIVSTVGALPDHGPWDGSLWLVYLAPSLCAIVMCTNPRRSRPRWRRLLWLAIPIAAGIGQSSGEFAALPFLLVFASAGGLLALPADVRPAIACSLVWASLGLDVALLGGQPIALLAVLVAPRSSRSPQPACIWWRAARPRERWPPAALLGWPIALALRCFFVHGRGFR